MRIILDFLRNIQTFSDDWGFDEAWVFAKHFFELGLKAQKGEQYDRQKNKILP